VGSPNPVGSGDVAGGVNGYRCGKCGYVTMTLNLVTGTTPFSIACTRPLWNGRLCGQSAFSAFYRVVQDPLAATYEWYRPSDDELAYLCRRDPEQADDYRYHVQQGGLLMRPRTAAAPDGPTPPRPDPVQADGLVVQGDDPGAEAQAQAVAQAIAQADPAEAPARVTKSVQVPVGDFEARRAKLAMGYQYRRHQGRGEQFKRLRRMMVDEGHTLARRLGPDLDVTAVRVAWTERAATLPDALAPNGVAQLRDLYFKAAGICSDE